LRDHVPERQRLVGGGSLVGLFGSVVSCVSVFWKESRHRCAQSVTWVRSSVGRRVAPSRPPWGPGPYPCIAEARDQPQTRPNGAGAREATGALRGHTGAGEARCTGNGIKSDHTTEAAATSGDGFPFNLNNQGPTRRKRPGKEQPGVGSARPGGLGMNAPMHPAARRIQKRNKHPNKN
jgi:hypothetical protein